MFASSRALKRAKTQKATHTHCHRELSQDLTVQFIHVPPAQDGFFEGGGTSTKSSAWRMSTAGCEDKCMECIAKAHNAAKLVS